MITKTYPFKTEEEKTVILLHLNVKYGHLYDEGKGEIYLDEKNNVIITTLSKERI